MALRHITHTLIVILSGIIFLQATITGYASAPLNHESILLDSTSQACEYEIKSEQPLKSLRITG